MIFIQLGWKILVLASIHYSQQLIFFKAYGTQFFLCTLQLQGSYTPIVYSTGFPH